MTPKGVVEVIPVRVNMNLKTLTVEDLESQKRDMHLAAFKYQIQRLEREAAGRAEDEFRSFGWNDATPPAWQRSVLNTIQRFKKEAEDVRVWQEGQDNSKYLEKEAADEGFYMKRVADIARSLSAFALKCKVMMQTVHIAAPWGFAPAPAPAPAPVPRSARLARETVPAGLSQAIALSDTSCRGETQCIRGRGCGLWR